jgi:hypothetical protein
LKLFNLAMEGNVGALIWLSKQYCGMRDQVQLGMDPDNPFPGGGSSSPLIELVFIESDGDGRPKVTTLEGNAKESGTPAIVQGRVRELTNGSA